MTINWYKCIQEYLHQTNKQVIDMSATLARLLLVVICEVDTQYCKLYMMNPLTVSIDLFVHTISSAFPVSIDIEWMICSS